MKKTFALFLTLILALAFCASAFADDPDEIKGTVEIPYAGLRFVPPETHQNTAGQIFYNGYESFAQDCFYSVWYYCAMTEAELEALLVADAETQASAPVSVLFYAFSIGNGMSAEEISARLGLDAKYVFDIGNAGKYTFFLYMEPEQAFIDTVDPVYAEEYTSLMSQPEQVVSAFTCYEPLDRYASLIGSKVTFTTTDLDGNAVSSADLFAQNEITMVNIWATWCGPCIGELAELQSIHTRMQEKGCGIVGLLDDTDLDEARRLVEENGITYPVILAPDDYEAYFPIEGYPSSFFINSEGEILASPIVGAYVEAYEPAFDSLLQK